MSNVVELENYRENISETVTFRLGSENFAMEVTRVEEIIDEVHPTKVPGADAFAPAVINVRGNVVPLVDLHHRFSLRPSEDHRETRFIVFEVEMDGEILKAALCADSVQEVSDLAQFDITELPEVGTRWNRDYVKGITRKEGQVVILLDMEKVFEGGNNAFNN